MSEITVYTAPQCPQCTMTKKLLDKRGADYTCVDLSTDSDALALVRELGYSAAPVVVAGDVHFSSFRPDALDRLVADQLASTAAAAA